MPLCFNNRFLEGQDGPASSASFVVSDFEHLGTFSKSLVMIKWNCFGEKTLFCQENKTCGRRQLQKWCHYNSTFSLESIFLEEILAGWFSTKIQMYGVHRSSIVVLEIVTDIQVLTWTRKNNCCLLSPSLMAKSSLKKECISFRNLPFLPTYLGFKKL